MTGRLQTAEILAIGTELLTPFRSDTNSLYLTARLNELGLEVRGKRVVGDNRAEVEAAVRSALSHADVVITTGGLGPTDDDVTREAVAAAADVASNLDESVLALIEERFRGRGLRMPDINRRQAKVPSGAVVLPNPNGTAPGLWMEIKSRIVIALPGPPRELQPMYEAAVLPRLRDRCGHVVLRRRILKLTGRGESHVDEIAHPIYGPWQTADPAITTTILAAPGQVELHLSARGEDEAALDRRLEGAVSELQSAFGRAVFSTDGRGLEQVVGDLLVSRRMMLAAAESCTGGLLLGALTDVPGCSAWIAGGVVAYANEVKMSALGVPEDTIALHGAVSEAVAQAMAEGVRRRLSADIGVGITGIAGPTGATATKPVGTVALAVAGPGARRAVRTVQLPGDRAMVRQMAIRAAMDQIRRALTDADYN